MDTDKHIKFSGRETLPDVHEIEDTTDWEADSEDDTHDEDGEVDSADLADENVLFHSVVKHENKRYALIRKERGARTEEDFENLVVAYDGIDTNREKREKRYEKISTELSRDFLIRGHQTIIPAPLEHTWWRELLHGDFLNVIHDCPCDIQEFFGSRIFFELLDNLKESQKEVLYYRAIRYWSNQKIAVMRGQTDRNILKTYETLVESLRYKLYIRLLPRYKEEGAEKENDKIEEILLTYNQRKFMEENEEKYGDGKPKRNRRTKAEIEKTAIDSGKNK